MNPILDKRQFRKALCAALLGLALPAAFAWTDKPVKLVVPAPAGGTMDVIARLVGEQLAADIGQPVIVENRPGAGGGIGVQALRAAPADGQTLLVTASNVLTEIPHVLKSGFDPLKDVRPLGVVGRSNLVLVAAPNVPAKDLKAFVAHARSNPGKLSFASYSAGSASHYAGMILNQKAGLDLQHVPFPGSPPALAQVLGGQIPLMFDGYVTSRAMISAGKLQAYAVAGKSRLTQLPDVPTMTELGYPDVSFSNWVGVVASAAVPNEVAEKIHDAVAKVARNPKFRGRMFAVGFEAGEELSLDQFAQSVRTEYERNAGIVRQFNIQLN
ncbi:Bug family tripartite tricarboxylate transporter substrate binding protein [Ramlibacter sp. MAHUQ-53]|uniref:Bug family tripartite tricarboxylate transporter substrate binding protein n=1 Tax=unclassified Ramlibacter TaxID=2617605 RepID=UPI00363BEBFF